MFFWENGEVNKYFSFEIQLNMQHLVQRPFIEVIDKLKRFQIRTQNILNLSHFCRNYQRLKNI